MHGPMTSVAVVALLACIKICTGIAADGLDGLKLLRKEKRHDEIGLDHEMHSRRKEMPLRNESIGSLEHPRVWSLQLPRDMLALLTLIDKDQGGVHSSPSLLAGYRTEPTFEFTCDVPVPGWQVTGTIMKSLVVNCHCTVGTGEFAMSAIGVSGANSNILTCLGDACPSSPEVDYDYTFQCLSSQTSLTQTAVILSAGSDLRNEDINLVKTKLNDLANVNPEISLVAADIHTRDLLNLGRLMESFSGDGNAAASLTR